MSQGSRPAVINEGVLPAVLEVPQAARMLGIGRTLAYELVRTGKWPTPVIRMGRLVKVPTQPLMEFLATGDRTTRDAAGLTGPAYSKAQHDDHVSQTSGDAQ